MFGIVFLIYIWFMPNTIQIFKNYDIYIETIKVSSLESTNKVFAMLQFKENWYWAIFVGFLYVASIATLMEGPTEFIYFVF